MSRKHGDAMPRTGKILIVDDAPFIRELLVDHLERQGHHMSEAGSGVDALAAISADRPDVIILDIDLGPGIGGVEVLRQTRTTDPAIGVIMMTGYRDPTLARETIDLGALDCLFKPIDLRRLSNLIVAFLDQGPA